jgi:malate/lactate dehydrogenase
VINNIKYYNPNQHLTPDTGDFTGSNFAQIYIDWNIKEKAEGKNMENLSKSFWQESQRQKTAGQKGNDIVDNADIIFLVAEIKG